MGVVLLMKGFCAAVIGGFGNVFGAVVGGLVLGVVESIGAGFISSAYKDVIAFGVLILVLMIRPTGLFSFKTQVKA
jgi:branched-chain amino acid transport system permease protein